MKRMFAPDDDEKPFIARWNMLTRVLLVESSVKLVARSAMDFADFGDGSSCRPSIDRVSRETGLSDRTVRNAWSVMRGIGMAVRVSRGVPALRMADEYELQIPAGWKSLPCLGPHARKFTCPGCGELFNPPGHTLLGETKAERSKDFVRWDLGRLTFCSWRRDGVKGRSDCIDAWNASRLLVGEKPWRQLGRDASWGVFFEARADPW